MEPLNKTDIVIKYFEVDDPLVAPQDSMHE